MKDYYQYRITVNSSQGQITDNYPGDQWSKIAGVKEERNIHVHAILERRLITDETI